MSRLPISSLIAGVLAAVVVVLGGALPAFLGSHFAGVPWNHASGVLAVTAMAFLLQRFVLERTPGNRNYDGLADLFLHIHTPSSVETPLRWVMRGAVSFFLALLGGWIGMEGAAIEWAHALLSGVQRRSARWYEHRRRTDASVALAAGVSAAFGAPLAAVVWGLELGIGGRALSAALAAGAAFFSALFFQTAFNLPSVRIQEGLEFGSSFWSLSQTVGLVGLALACGALAAGWVRFYRYSQDSLRDLFQSQAWMRVLTGGTLLFLVGFVSPAGLQPPWRVFQSLVWFQRTGEESLLLAAGQALSLALVLSGLGTLGVFWSLFLMGGLLGSALGLLVIPSVPAVLIGSAAFLGAVLGTPLAASLLVFEMTSGDPLARGGLLVLAYVAAMVATRLRGALRTPSLTESDLNARGLRLRGGRVQSVLDSLSVHDAMVSDHEVVHEQEPVSDLRNRLLKSRYPFLPVVNAAGMFRGLLTIDAVQESWRRQERVPSSAPVAKFLEIKDLLYRSGGEPRTVRPQDRLSATTGIFDDVPCVAVVAEDGRVQGLLFAHHVRLAYEREVARRSLAWEQTVGLI